MIAPGVPDLPAVVAICEAVRTYRHHVPTTRSADTPAVRVIREAFRPCRNKHAIKAAVDDLLDNVELFRLLRKEPPTRLQGDLLSSPGVAGYENRICNVLLDAEKAHLEIESKALFVWPAADLNRSEYSDLWRYTQEGPPSYFGYPHIPPAVQQRLMSRDIAQITLIGFLAQPTFGVHLTQMLVELFLEHQGVWNQFLQDLLEGPQGNLEPLWIFPGRAAFFEPPPFAVEPIVPPAPVKPKPAKPKRLSATDLYAWASEIDRPFTVGEAARLLNCAPGQVVAALANLSRAGEAQRSTPAKNMIGENLWEIV